MPCAISIFLVLALVLAARSLPSGYKIDYQNKKPDSVMNEMVTVDESVND
jgi:hypothetical protein